MLRLIHLFYFNLLKLQLKRLEDHYNNRLAISALVFANCIFKFSSALILVSRMKY